MRFDWLRLEFGFTALERVEFPPVMAANILRGALGMLSDDHLYRRIFNPQPAGRVPSGLAEPPRPFVFRARHLDGLAVAPGGQFGFVLHLFLPDPEIADHLRQTFASLEEHGLGPARSRVALRSMATEARFLDLTARADTGRVSLQFLTPTELKVNGRLAEQPDFPALFGRIRDRVCTLRSLYGSGPLEIDFRAMAERAAQIRMTLCDIAHQSSTRYSSRTKQTHSLGGFTGSATYEGDVGGFVPWLEAAQATGVGRQAVWGKGEIRLLEI